MKALWLKVKHMTLVIFLRWQSADLCFTLTWSKLHKDWLYFVSLDPFSQVHTREYQFMHEVSLLKDSYFWKTTSFVRFLWIQMYKPSSTSSWSALHRRQLLFSCGCHFPLSILVAPDECVLSGRDRMGIWTQLWFFSLQ